VGALLALCLDEQQDELGNEDRDEVVVAVCHDEEGTAGAQGRLRLMGTSPVDEVISAVRERRPGVQIDRLEVTHPVDDENLWFFRAASGADVQLESGPGGVGPFLIEGDRVGQRAEASDVSGAVEIVLDWLGPG
jgi:hypothetical protein